MNKGRTQISNAAKNLENLISNQHFEGALYIQCADVIADTECSGSELCLIRSFSALLTFSLCEHTRESSYTEKHQFPKLRRAHGTALEGGIGTSVSPGITGRRDLGPGEKAENIRFCLH